MNEINYDDSIEDKLHNILNPVIPRKNYIEDLQQKLTSKPDVSIEYPNYLILILTLSSGLVFGVMLFMFLNKLFKTIGGRK